ncbi:MAG: inactive transglutaminase family protein [Hahellaceae bacterium]|nr:inactive transglutaminase family protein [Hahellaceae bacterium]
MTNGSVKFWVIVLAAIGLGVTAYKSYYLGLPLTPKEEAEVWTVQARVSFKGTGGPAKVNLYLPEKTPGFLKLDEDFISSQFGLTTEKVGENLQANWAIRRARSLQVLYYRVNVAKSPIEVDWGGKPKFPEPPTFSEIEAPAIQAILDDVRNSSADVESYTRELLNQLNAEVPNENVKVIRRNAETAEQWVSQIIEILKGVKIPARDIWGIELSDARNDLRLQPLLQVHNGQKWITFHPKTGNKGMPSNFLVWKIGKNPLFEVEGGNKAQLDISVTKSYKDLINVASTGVDKMDSVFSSFSLMALPVEDQNVYRLLLMVPLGAVLMVVLRTFVGIKTFGTFMPVLIAIAFRETQLFWGIVMFTMIVSVGLLIRFYLERLMLLLVPRLASILIIVVILMLITSSFTNMLGAERLLSIALFPMVILAMTIERMSITWEENGAREAMKQGIGSLLVACVGYLVMTNEELMYLMFVFPELLLVMLSFCLMMGRYTGYRLVELTRFKDMLRNEKS